LKPMTTDFNKERFRYLLQPYLFVLPALIILIIFRYIPMVGLQIAFKDFIAPKGFFGSPWVGLKHYIRFYNSPTSGRVIMNTVKVTFLGLLFGFPWPIIMALGLNEVDSLRAKKLIQTITWAPHFVSIVVIVGMIFLFTSPTTGLINLARNAFGLDPIHFMVVPSWFLPLYIISGIWQHLGWGTIIYLATLTSVSPELHESAIIDGATRFQRVIKINLPFLLPIIVIQLILQSGQMLNVGFEKVFLMQTPLNQNASEVLSTYTYRAGILGGQFSFATAVGLFRSIFSLILIMAVNRIAKAINETSLW
jgi:putative aldouronate transport system permease protein